MSTGLYARRVTGLTVAEREESYTWTESVARWSRQSRVGAYEAEREALLFHFFLLCRFDRYKVFQLGRKLLHERGREFSFFIPKFSVSFSLFLRYCCAVLCSLSYIRVQTYSISKEEKSPLPGVCTYVRHVSERSGQNRPRREAYVASELFSPEAWRRDSWHYQVASLQL